MGKGLEWLSIRDICPTANLTKMSVTYLNGEILISPYILVRLVKLVRVYLKLCDLGKSILFINIFVLRTLQSTLGAIHKLRRQARGEGG